MIAFEPKQEIVFVTSIPTKNVLTS